MGEDQGLALLEVAINRVPRSVFGYAGGWEGLHARSAGLVHRIYFYCCGPGQVPGFECESRGARLSVAARFPPLAPVRVLAGTVPLTCITCYVEWLRRQAEDYE